METATLFPVNHDFVQNLRLPLTPPPCPKNYYSPQCTVILCWGGLLWGEGDELPAHTRTAHPERPMMFSVSRSTALQHEVSQEGTDSQSKPGAKTGGRAIRPWNDGILGLAKKKLSMKCGRHAPTSCFGRCKFVQCVT